MSKKSLKSKSETGLSEQRQNIRSSPPTAGSQQGSCESEIAPLCACGCGRQVLWSARLKTWNTILRYHNLDKMRQGIDQTKRAAAVSAAARARMLSDANPMKNPEIAARVSAATKGRSINRSAEGTKAIADAARRRMLSDANPMKQAGAHQAAMSKIMSRSDPSKNEVHFMEWAKARSLPVEFVGNGSLWIGRRNPDFRVPGQRKLIEVTQRECFTNKRQPRTPADYGTQTARHYLSKGWQVLVIWKKDHRCLIPEQLTEVIRRFALPEYVWSGAWHFDKLLAFDGLAGEFVSTT